MTQTIHFIDAHHHLWIPESDDPDLGYRWLRDIGAMKPFGDPTAIQRNYEWPEFSAETQHRLAGSVYLQVDGAIADPVAETAWVQSVFDTTGLRHGIVGLVDLSSEHAADILSRQCAYPLFKGVRQIISRLDDNPALSFAPVHYLRDARWRDQFQMLSDHSLSFDLQLYPEQMAEAANFLKDFPTVPVIVDHAGSPHDQSPEGLATYHEALATLASLENVAIKLCGFGMFDTRRSSDTIKPLIECIVELFGYERMMFGSNFPVDKLMGSYDDVLQMISDCLGTANAQQRDAVWRGNAERIYRL